LTGAGVAPARPALAAGRAPQRTPGVRAAPTRRSGTQEHFASHPVAPQFHRGGIPVLVSPPRFVRPPRFFLGVTPFHPHRHWFFKRHRGVVFIDAFPWAAPVVITQVAPGVIAERRFSDEVPGESRPREAGQLAPFDPTPQEVVERMLALAAVKKGDVVYDLGSGDGRILITAAKKYGVRGVGYEIDAGLIKLARENAKRQGVAHLVEFRHEDFLAADLSAATVVTLYLSQDGNLAVRAQLMQQLNRGARVVSYTFDMGEWQPKISESYRDAAGDTHAIYLWEIGEPMLFSDRRGGGEGPLIIDVP
jgi:precorrin-6B methylase 2